MLSIRSIAAVAYIASVAHITEIASRQIIIASLAKKVIRAVKPLQLVRPAHFARARAYIGERPGVRIVVALNGKNADARQNACVCQPLVPQ